MSIRFKGRLLVASTAVEHGLSPGIAPSRFVIEGPRQLMLEAYQQDDGQPGGLAIGGDVTGGMTLVTSGPGSEPHLARLMFYDGRYKLPYMTLVRDYNLRERTGAVRLVGEGNLDKQQPVPEIRYRPHSLKGEGRGSRPWALEEAVTDALEEVKQRLGIGFEAVPSFARDLPLEDFSEARPGDQFLGMLLGRAPGYSFTWSRAGQLAITDTTSEEETRRELEKVPVTLWGGGYYGFNNNSRMRPSRLRIHFVREQELRFDYDEDAEERGAATVDSARPPRKLENILENPIRILKLDGRNIGEGTVVTLAELFAALPKQGDPSLPPDTTGTVAFGPLSFDTCRRFLRDADTVPRFYTATTEPEPLQNLVAIMRELQASFRRNFRILPQWRQFIRTFKAQRVALLDPVSRSFGETRPYTDVTYVPTFHSIVYRAPKLGPRVRNETGVIFSGYNDDLSKARSVKARVGIRNQEAGTFRVSYQGRDSYGQTEGVLPGHLEYLPEIVQQEGRVGGRFGNMAQIPFKRGWKLAVIFTCTQAAPNGLGRFHTEERTPQDAERRLGRPVGPCSGPVMDVFIPETPTTTARFAWDDARANAIDEAFYTGANGPPRDLLVNDDVVEGLADAAAASIYAQMIDTFEGTLTTISGTGVEPRGQIGLVRSDRPMNRGALTSLAFTGTVRAGDLFAFLPQSLRRQVFGTVQ